MKQFTARAYNNFVLDKCRSITTKTSDTDRLRDEICYYKDIHNTKFSCFFPRLFSSDEDKGCMSLEYYAYKDLGKQLIEDENNTNTFPLYKWEAIAQKLSDVLEMLKVEALDPKFFPGEIMSLAAVRDKENMYIDKTLHYYHELVNNFEYFNELSNRDKITVNGKTLHSFMNIWDRVVEQIQKLINTKSMTIIHGDMCFSNILYHYDSCNKDASIIKFIDPRGRFGQKGIYGDPLYDVAKLIHSYEGRYEYIINDQFEIKFDSTDIRYNFKYPDCKHKVEDAFNQFKIFTNPAAKLVTGLIFIGMCSRHYDSLERQIIMYCTGLKILNEVIE